MNTTTLNPLFTPASTVKEFLCFTLLRLDQKRIELHLKRTLRYLQSTDTSHLSPVLIANRKRHLKSLEQYIQTGVFPINEHHSSRTPIFRDNYHTLCAMAYVLWKDREYELVNEVAKKDNLVYINQITDGPVLEWIQKSGLTQSEAARVQPTYGPELSVADREWIMPILEIIFYSALVLFSSLSLICTYMFNKYGSSVPKWAQIFRTLILAPLFFTFLLSWSGLLLWEFPQLFHYNQIGYPYIEVFFSYSLPILLLTSATLYVTHYSLDKKLPTFTKIVSIPALFITLLLGSFASALFVYDFSYRALVNAYGEEPHYFIPTLQSET